MRIEGLAAIIVLLGCFTWIFLCAGDPDILDGIVHCLMK